MTETEELTRWEIRFADSRDPKTVEADGWKIEPGSLPYTLVTFGDIEGVPIYSVRLVTVLSIEMIEAIDRADGSEP